MKNLQDVLRANRDYLTLLALIKDHPNLLTNVRIYHYKATVKIEGDKTLQTVEGLHAVNMEFQMSIDWQIEFHIMSKYPVLDFAKKVTFKEITI